MPNSSHAKMNEIVPNEVNEGQDQDIMLDLELEKVNESQDKVLNLELENVNEGQSQVLDLQEEQVNESQDQVLDFEVLLELNKEKEDYPNNEVVEDVACVLEIVHTSDLDDSDVLNLDAALPIEATCFEVPNIAVEESGEIENQNDKANISEDYSMGDVDIGSLVDIQNVEEILPESEISFSRKQDTCNITDVEKLLEKVTKEHNDQDQSYVLAKPSTNSFPFKNSSYPGDGDNDVLPYPESTLSKPKKKSTKSIYFVLTSDEAYEAKLQQEKAKKERERKKQVKAEMAVEKTNKIKKAVTCLKKSGNKAKAKSSNDMTNTKDQTLSKK